MELDNIILGQSLTLSDYQNQIPIETFQELIKVIQECYKDIGINSEQMKLEYHRFSNRNSVLAIQLLDARNYDRDNYMFIGCTPGFYSQKIYCDIFMHADAKCAKEALEVSRRISKNIINFFEKTETTLNKNGLNDISFSVEIPLNEDKKEQPPKGNKVKQLFKKLYKHI